MAKKRGPPAKARRGQRHTAGRRRQAARPRAQTAAVESGAREVKRDDPARQVEAQPGPRLVAWDGGGSEEGKGRPAAEAAAAGGAGVPDPARWGVGEALHEVPRGPAAQTHLGRESDADRAAEHPHDERPDVPALSQIAIELTIGALRLFRTVVTAPVRLALSFLRQREA